MNEQVALQNKLNQRFAELKRKNASYSIRALAKRIGLNSGALSSILNGKRNVSPTLARRICENLGLDPQERMEILDLFPKKRAYSKPTQAANPDGSTSAYVQLSAAQFRVVAEWQHFGILVLMRTRGFKSEAEWIARRLGLTVPKTEKAISRLISVGLLEQTEDGCLKRATHKFRTSDDVVDLSVRRSHEENMDLAKEALHKNQVTERDFTHISLAIHPKNLSMAKELIRKFEDEFAKLVESEDATEVYRLSMQFFPLTTLNQESSHEK
jgi:uncharacterized protein (TIGR02147 family)